MAPNSRPPLTSRIRASFEGRRKSFEGTRKLSKSGRGTTADSNGNGANQEVRSPTAIDSEVDSPLHTTGFITQDPNAIRDAVDQAINGEAFQTAIAANLAKLIKPSIKSALDTIQPVVEAVYSHEMLLRKTNQSVEDVLSRMDTNAETAAAVRRESFIDSTYVAPGTPADGEKSADAVEGAIRPREIGGPDFDQFRQLMEEHHAKTLATISESIETNNTKIAELAQGVSELNASVGPTKESIDSLKSASEEATTTSSVLQAQLDQLKLDIGQIIEAIGADLGKNIQTISERSGAAPDTDLLSSHTTKLDLISTDLAALKGHADTVEKIDAISSELGALKASVEAGNTSNAEGFTNVLAAVGEHTTVLGEIREKAPHPEILAALQQSNDSHALHTTTLSEIKERSLGSAPAAVVSEGGSVDHSSALEQIQTDLTALKENIAAGLTNNSDLGVKIDTVLTTIEGNKAEDPSVEILAAVKQSNESHAAHAAALEGLKSNSADVNPELGTQITGIVGKLDEHSTALEEIKAFGGTHTAALEGIKSTSAEPPADAGDLLTQIAAILAKLDTHTAVLDEIKGGSGSTNSESTPIDTGDITTQIGAITTKLDAHAATLDEIKGLSGAHATALEGHGTALESIKSVAPENSSVDTSDLTAQIDAIVAKLDAHTVALDEIKGIGGSHATALEGIKSISPESAPTQETGDLNTHIATIVGKLDEHSSALEELKGLGGSHATALESHGAALEGIKSWSPSAPAEGGNADLDGQIAAIVATLEKHGAALDEIKTQTTTIESHGPLLDEIKTSATAHTTALENHGAAIEGIKTLSATVPAEGGNSALDTQIAAIVATLDSHGSALDEIKTSTGTHITALESHGTALEGLRSLHSSSPAEATDAPGIESQIGAIITTLESHGAALEEIKTAGGAHTSVLDEIKTFGTAHATALETHGSVLEDIKSRSVEPVLAEGGSAGLERQITDLVSKLDSHGSVLEEIKGSTGSHSLVLDEIKLATTTHADVLEGMRSSGIPTAPAVDPMSLAALEIQIGSIISTLETHSAAWNEIKARNYPESTAVVPTEGSDSGTPDGPFAIIIETLTQHTNLLNEIKEDVAAEILTALHDIGQTQANQTNLLTEIREADLDDEILTLLHASSDSHSSHTSALDKIHSAVVISNESHTAHTTSLDEIKSRSIEPAPAGASTDLGDLREKISGIVEKLEEYSATLSAIKDATAASNDSHAAHTTSLDEIKSRSIDATPAEGANLGGLEAQIGDIVTKLDDHTAVLSAIKDATSVSNESHTAHTAILTELKDQSASSLESHTAHATILGEIKDSTIASRDLHSAHATSLSELKEATSGFNDNHAATLSEIKEATLASQDAHASHTAAFTELKSIQPGVTPAAESSDLSSLDTQIKSILTTLEAQTATLSAINEGTANPNPEILAAIQQSHELLTSHGPLLEAIKEGTSHADILTNISELKSILEDSKADVASHGALVKDLHAETKDSHSNLASAIGALAVGGAAGAGATVLLSKDDDESSSAVLDEVKAVRALIETSAANVEDTKEKVTTLAAQIEINHTTITTSITTLSDELKAEIDASGTGIVESITTLDGDVKAIDVAPLSASLQQQSQDIKSLSTQLEALDGNIKENNTHITTLHSGVHFNDIGIDQLKDHAVSRSVVAPSGAVAKQMSMAEGAWFGSAWSGSRSPTLSRVVSRDLVEPVPETVEGIKEVGSNEDLPIAEEVVEAVAEPKVVSEGEEKPEGALSPITEEESIADREAPVEDQPVLVDDASSAEEPEVVEAESPVETPAAEDTSADEPEAVPEVNDSEELPKEEEVVEADSPSKESVAVDAAIVEPEITAPVDEEETSEDDPAPIVEADAVVEPEALTEDQPVTDEISGEVSTAEEVVEAELPTYTPDVEEASVDEPDSLPDVVDDAQQSTEDSVPAAEPVEDAAEAKEIEIDDDSPQEKEVDEDVKLDTTADEQLYTGDAAVETELTPTEPEPVAESHEESLEPRAPSPEAAVEESVVNDSQALADESMQPDAEADEPTAETSANEIANGSIFDESHLEVEAAKEIAEPDLEQHVETEPQVEAEPAAISDDKDIPEGTTVREPEHQSEDDPITGGAPSEQGDEHAPTVLGHAMDLPNPEIEEPSTSDLQSDGEISRPSPIELAQGDHPPDSPLPSLDTAVEAQPDVFEHDEALPSSDANWPLSTHETVETSSPFIESPTNALDLDEPFTSYRIEQAPFPSAQHNLLGDQDLDSGHATPLDDARSNPFEDSDNLLSPASVLSPQAEIDAPTFPAHGRMESIDESGFRSPDSDAIPPATFPVFPATVQHAGQQRFEDSDDVMSPTSEYDAPVFSDTRQLAPGHAARHDLTREFDTQTPQPTFPSFPGTGQGLEQRDYEDSDDVISPSSEYNAPAFSDMRQRTPNQNQPFDSPEFTPAPSFPVFPGTAQHSQQRFDDSDDAMSLGTGYDAHGLPHMTQESPFHSRQPDTSYDPSSPQFERDPASRPHGLQRESSFDYQQENYEPAMLPRNLSGQHPAQEYDDDDFRSPHDTGFASRGLGRRSPLQPLDDDDYRAGQYERYSPGPEFSDLRQRSPVDSQRFDESHGTLPPHLQLDRGFPAARQRSPIQPFEDEYSSPQQQRYSPEPESSPFIQRQYSPETTPPRPGTLRHHLQLDTTPPFRSTSPIDPYSERDSEIVSPSSEFAVPITPGMSARLASNPAAQTDDVRSPESEFDEPTFPTQSYKGKAITSPGPLSPDLGSPADFGFSREETETEPESALASPTSPVFSEGGTMVEKSGGGAGGKKKKGKKEKKEKKEKVGGGGKKGKKEKVPFEMEGEDAE
ncbi:hypothetical protein ONS95_001303 [Cadophora gregata]|uniref:uncharacterized protein n=1 Tax=Cadophora gregata TaxID=51156 RepID=UPI0026DD8FD5|nr:uncharacterized protein ONS95_001303 [Cadophora gregata]KAK0101885.1 hypothetical protein ONS96_005860 [Cadophora gregata f. sp. sojae]KAK0129377.1 hypothetical protein ONS95_001303 [Cadophora gregata]